MRRRSTWPACLASVLAGSLASSSCAGDADTRIDLTYDPCETLVVAEGATPEQLASVDRALELWNDRGDFRLVRSDHAAPERPRLPVRFDGTLGLFRGYYDDEAGVILIHPKLAFAPRSVTLAHELGHAFGLLHVERSKQRSVMNPGNLDVEPTPEDIAEVQSLWGRCPARSPGG